MVTFLITLSPTLLPVRFLKHRLSPAAAPCHEQEVNLTVNSVHQPRAWPHDLLS